MININQPNKDLAKFYEAWSSKSVFQIDYDIESAERKAKVIINLLPKHYLNSFTRILDFGCGYGALLLKIKKILNSNNLFAIGLDYSEMAIDIANKRNGISTLRYESLHHFEIKENIPFINEMIEGKVDVIMLIDVLEHVPDCKELISELSPMTNYFLIKLPLESSIFDNYIIPKEYPGAAHSNGHLREFNVNNVHYFIRKLGLIPIFETTYIYNIRDTFPPVFNSISLRGRIIRLLLILFKITLSLLMPKKLFLRIIGGGGYICYASYSVDHILSP